MILKIFLKYQKLLKLYYSFILDFKKSLLKNMIFDLFCRSLTLEI